MSFEGPKENYIDQIQNLNEGLAKLVRRELNPSELADFEVLLAGLENPPGAFAKITDDQTIDEIINLAKQYSAKKGADERQQIAGIVDAVIEKAWED